MRKLNKDELELELQKGLDPKHIEKKQGFSYVAHAHMVANLNRLFGFDGWDIHQEPIETVHKSQEEKNGRTKYTIVCVARIRLTVRGRVGDEWRETVKEEVGTCGNTGYNAVDVWNTAYCGAPTYALKRAAHWMGNQFGSSLYDRNNPVHEGGDDKWAVVPEAAPEVIEEVNKEFTTEIKKARSKGGLEKVMVKFLPKLKTLPEEAKSNLRQAYKDKLEKINANGKGDSNASK